jgi:hypothetical protein
MAARTIVASACEIARVEDRVVLKLCVPSDDRDIAAVMSTKEARRLANRLGKAANDAAAAAARRTERTNA